MSFVQAEFLAFLLATFALYWGLPLRGLRRLRLQNIVLLVASAVFYGWVHPWYLGLLAFSALLDFSVGLGMARWPARKGALLLLSVAGNLGLLGVFKYLDFFVLSMAGALSRLGLEPGFSTLGILLPVGISFFTFQTLGYSIDVYRGKVRPRRNLLDYTVFVSFFPQLVAGPIERAGSLLPQLEQPRTLSWERLRSGIGLALWGVAKKIVVADTLALYVDRVFAMGDAAPVLVWAATVAFAVQILADFSGYTDIARGTARMFGIELMENFRHPYLATTPWDFWRRWHISLSSWIHEYLYLPLGGNRHGPGRAAFAASLSLLLSGLWHGASWNFLMWRAYHAALLLLYRLVVPRIPASLRQAPWARPPAVILMFGFTCVGWLVFRQLDLGALFRTLGAVPWAGNPAEQVVARVLLGLAIAGGLFLGLGGLLRERLWPRLSRHAVRLPMETGLWAAATALILLFARDTAHDFIYFRF